MAISTEQSPLSGNQDFGTYWANTPTAYNSNFKPVDPVTGKLLPVDDPIIKAWLEERERLSGRLKPPVTTKPGGSTGKVQTWLNAIKERSPLESLVTLAAVGYCLYKFIPRK